MASSVNEGKQIMLTQAIKRWFHKMFAWWPRNKSNEGTYVEATAIPYRESTQGTIFHATIEGTTNQQGSSIVKPKTGEWDAEHYILPPGVPETHHFDYPGPPVDTPSEPLPENQSRSPEQNNTPSPRQASDQEQQLEFLYYLVKKGVVNEGFDPDELPDQYRLS
ncbi:MAG TPA: hypothetical protein VFN23_17870 [Ktedonobacteraceae bacterium]|nr:hypothetical protein [Ktedonobacteraceae bacterium]